MSFMPQTGQGLLYVPMLRLHQDQALTVCWLSPQSLLSLLSLQSLQTCTTEDHIRRLPMPGWLRVCGQYELHSAVVVRQPASHTGQKCVLCSALIATDCQACWRDPVSCGPQAKVCTDMGCYCLASAGQGRECRFCH